MKTFGMKKTVLAMFLIVCMIMPSFCVSAASKVTMYAPDGRTISVSSGSVSSWKSVGWYDYPVSKVYAPDGRYKVISTSAVKDWCKVGWYKEPVTTLYSAEGKTLVVPLRQVYEYSKVGWYTPVNFAFKFKYKYIKNVFGSFKYELYYAGTPNSGDIPRTMYKGTGSNPFKKIAIYKQSCCYVEMSLSYVFPYLAMYADSEGNISLDELNNVLSNSGIYGSGYRSTTDHWFADFSKLMAYDGFCWGEYDNLSIGIDTNKKGKINIYTSTCFFSDLP